MTLGSCKDTTAIPAHLEGATDTRVHQGEATNMQGLQGDLTTVHLDGARYLTTGSALDVGIPIVLAWFLLGMTASLSIDCAWVVTAQVTSLACVGAAIVKVLAGIKVGTDIVAMIV